MKKLKKMLSNYNAPYIQSLMRLIETQSKETLGNWAMDYSENILLPVWNKYYPEDNRPLNALVAGRRWFLKEIKLPKAKKDILLCHEAARESDGNVIPQSIARAIGQSASTIHSPRHCIGLVFYGALALAYEKVGTDLPWDEIEKAAEIECKKMEDALRKVAVENEENPAKIIWHC